MPVCPICRGSAAPRARNGAFPFCSPRCKQVDLGKWLDQRYRVAIPDESEPETEEEDTSHPIEEKA